MTLSAQPVQLSIRSAELADAPQITAVINTAFRIAEEFFIDGNRITQAEVEESLAKGVFLLAEANGKVNGCVYVEPRGERSYLGLLSVDPTCQQGGLGSLLKNIVASEDRIAWTSSLSVFVTSSRHSMKSAVMSRAVRARFPRMSRRKSLVTSSTCRSPCKPWPSVRKKY
jgi:N-acetylglutamate synthase-like GNAT family acetyltransferase